MLDSDDSFAWEVWVSLSRDSFGRMMDDWEKPGRESGPSYFGWLSNAISGYPSTINLKTHVHTRPIGRSPAIELEPTDHPLAVEQRTGITAARVREIAELARHQQ
jgi:hypothetical protein